METGKGNWLEAKVSVKDRAKSEMKDGRSATQGVCPVYGIRYSG